MIYFKRKAAYPRKWTKETAKNWDQRWQQYEKHLRGIRNALPKNAWLLANFTFHDTTVEKVEVLSKRELVITLSRGWAGPVFKDSEGVIPKALLNANGHKLHFAGVKQAWVPPSIVGDIWIYEEIHLSKLAAFDYHVLLYRDEIRIQADDVRISAAADWPAL